MDAKATPGASEIREIYAKFLSELKALRSNQKEEMDLLIQKLIQQRLENVMKKIKSP